MRSAIVAATVAGVASAAWAPPAGYSSGWGEKSSSAAPVPVSSSVAPVYTTEVVTAYTTFCPEATKFTHSGVTYTATEATTLTITNCPGGCTISYPATSAAPVSSAGITTYPALPSSSPVTVSVAPYPSAAPNSTVGWSTVAPIGTTATASYGATGSPIASAPPATGGAAKSYSAAGAAIAAIFGLVAAL